MQSVANGTYSDPLALVGRQGDAAFARRMPGHIESLAKTRMQDDKKPEKISGTFARKLVWATTSLLIAALAMFASAHFFGDDISRAGHSTSQKNLEIVIGRDFLKVPANKIRFFSQRFSGAHDSLELYLHWPSLSGFRDGLSREFNSTENNSHLIFVSLEPRIMPLDMSGRMEPIYKQFFDGKPLATEFGLVQQPLSSKGGFIDEDLYYAADSPHPFTARCIRESSKGTTPFCIRDIQVGQELMLTYRFHKKHLPQWIELEQGVRATAKSLIVHPNQN